MVMVLVKRTACVLLVILCAAWLSTARLTPTGAEDNDEISAIKGSVATGSKNISKVQSQSAIERNLKKQSVKQVVRKCGNAKSAAIVECNRSLRSRLLSDEVDGGLVAFSADYRGPRHHPPKNN